MTHKIRAHTMIQGKKPTADVRNIISESKMVHVQVLTNKEIEIQDATLHWQYSIDTNKVPNKLALTSLCEKHECQGQ